jgi:hypothetical protein
MRGWFALLAIASASLACSTVMGSAPTAQIGLAQMAPTLTAQAPAMAPTTVSTQPPAETQSSNTGTSAAPAPERKPILLTGSGDAVIDAGKWDGPAIAHISCQGKGYFGVWSTDADGQQTDLLVNKGCPYDGIVAVDFLQREHTAGFKIKSEGRWKIDVRYVTSMRKSSVPGTIQGSSDDCIAFTGPDDPARISTDASQAESNFAIWTYGDKRSLVVNEIAPYTGTVAVGPDTYVIVVQATGPWTLQVASK